MGARCFGEFVGTAVLILLGDGVVANVLLKRSKAEGAGWLAIAAGWAFAVVFGVFTAIACGSPDGYINPAFTLGMAISSGDYSKFWPFLLAQVLGAIVGAVLVWVHFLPHWRQTEDADVKLLCFLERGHRHVCARGRRGRDLFEACHQVGSRCGPGAILGRRPCLGDRTAISGPASPIRFCRSARKMVQAGRCDLSGTPRRPRSRRLSRTVEAILKRQSNESCCDETLFYLKCCMWPQV